MKLVFIEATPRQHYFNQIRTAKNDWAVKDVLQAFLWISNQGNHTWYSEPKIVHDVIQHILNGCVRFYISATQRLVLTCLTAKSSGAVIFQLMELFRIICKNKKQWKWLCALFYRCHRMLAKYNCTVHSCGFISKAPGSHSIFWTTLSLLSSNKALCNLIWSLRVMSMIFGKCFARILSYCCHQWVDNCELLSFLTHFTLVFHF